MFPCWVQLQRAKDFNKRHWYLHLPLILQHLLNPFPLVENYVQDLQPELRTFNTAIIACNMCGRPKEALKVCFLS